MNINEQAYISAWAQIYAAAIGQGHREIDAEIMADEAIEGLKAKLQHQKTKRAFNYNDSLTRN